MATLTKEQVEQKMRQLQQLTEKVNAVAKELAEAGVIRLSETDLEKVTGGTDDEFYIAPSVYKQTDIQESQGKPGTPSEWDKRLIAEFAIGDMKKK